MSDIINALPQGTILRGPKNRYCIQRALGQGSFGITYLATTEMRVSGEMGSFTTRVQVAVKEFFMKELNGRSGNEVTAGSQSPFFINYRHKFLREAENLAKMQHPHIVKVLESFEVNGTAYYAMEYLDGGSLEGYISRQGSLSESEAKELACQVGEALEHMHVHQMLHLDLKPANVMLRSTGEAVLIDFGLSKQFDKNGEPESSTSLGGGTEGYAPIEQANYQRGDGLPVTMDVYAFGATLYKILTGERPPKAEDVLNDGFPSFVLQRKGVSPATIAVVEKAMAPMRKKRYQSVREVVEALGGRMSPAPHPVRPLPEKQPLEEQTVVTPTPAPEPMSSPTPFGKVWKYIGMGVAAVICLALIVVNTPLKDGSFVGEGVNNVAYDEHIQSIIANDLSYKMIRVEGGTFTMGATSEQGSNAYDDEKPAHQVTLSSYYIGETEVTQALWQAVMGSNPSNFKGNDRPVEQVSWDDCQEFIRKLNALTGKRFRLPTEAEWEYAARGGKKSQGYKYSGSNSLAGVAWYGYNSGSETHPVKTKSPNELGLYDMSGNVYEWCQDWDGNYSSSSQTNPIGSSSGSFRVRRGGSWSGGAGGCRVSFRSRDAPVDRFNDLGFRLVL